MNIPPEEYIRLDDYEKSLRDVAGVKVCAVEHIPEFWKEHANASPYVLVSSGSDYGVCLQKDFFPNTELVKWVGRVEWQKIQEDRQRYTSIQLGPAADIKRCRPTDIYSIKIDSYTTATFESVPANVIHWFTTNLNINHPRMTLLPYGLNTDGPGSSYLSEYVGRPKDKLLYVNFQVNTQERVYLKERYKDCPFATYRAEPNLPVRQYFEELAASCFCLVPFGNGFDSYRLLESLYLSTVPVMKSSPFSLTLRSYGLPILVVDSLFDLTEKGLAEFYYKLMGDTVAEPYGRAITKTYWIDKITRAAASC